MIVAPPGPAADSTKWNSSLCEIVTSQEARSVVEYGLENNILFSTDYPHHDSPWPEGVNTFLGLEGLTDTVKRKIMWDNGAALYGLEAPVALAAAVR